MIGRSARLQRVLGPVNGDRGNGNGWFLGQPCFQVSQRRVSRCVPEVETIGVDDDINEVRVVERGRCPLERLIVKGPGR